MGDGDDEDGALLIVDLVERAVIADADRQTSRRTSFLQPGGRGSSAS